MEGERRVRLRAVAQVAPVPRERTPDLGDVAEGRYFRDMISDSKVPSSPTGRRSRPVST